MAKVLVGLDAKVSTNSARKSNIRIIITKHMTGIFDNVETFPNHGDHGTRIHVLNEAREKVLAREGGIVLFEMFLRSVHHFHGDQFVSFLFESFDDFSNSVRFHHDESMFFDIPQIVITQISRYSSCFAYINEAGKKNRNK